MRRMLSTISGASFLMTASVAAATINVPGDLPTIQDAIDVAANGDEVVVAPGIWTGTGQNVVDFLGKSITVRSSNGPDVTFIDGQNLRRGVTFSGGETSSSIIKGFTVRNGLVPSSSTSSEGGGIWCAANTSASIIDCMITGNMAWAGAGVMLRGTNSVSGCTIVNNNTHDDTSVNSYGGGIYCLGNSIVTNCDIDSNGSYWGGGVVFFDSDAQLINCTVSANSSVQGGGLYIRNQSPTIDECTIEGNTAQYGGAAYLFTSSSPVFTDCIISDNSGSSFAGAIAAYLTGPAVLRNCSISHNNSPGNGGGIWMLQSQAVMQIDGCRITSNSSGGSGGGVYSDNGLVSLAETLVCDNAPNQIIGPWSNGGGNEVSEICLLGACCDGPDCSLVTQVECESISGSTWLGANSTCDDCLAINNGACCLNEEFRGASNCIITDPVNCEDLGGDWQGSGTDCTACVPPPQPGACCLVSGCALMWQDPCLSIGGTWLGNDSSCDDCPASGACCLCDGCLQTWEQDCLNAGGDWLANLECNDCPPVADAGPCCMASGCIMNATEQECVDNLGEWLGSNGDCADCPQACFGDLNGDWIVDIDDLLILLGAYGICP